MKKNNSPIMAEVAGDVANVDLAEPEKALVDIEVASAAGGRDITQGYIDALPYLPSHDTILQQKGDGTTALYETLYSDPDVKIAWDQRSLGLVAKEWAVEPGGDDRQSKKAADQLREALNHVGWDSATQKMQFGVLFGYGFAEMMWASDGNTITLDTIKVKKARRFRFAPDGSPLLLTTQAPAGEKLPPRKFWGFNCGAIDDDDPYGIGLGHWLYWPVWFRRNGEKFWSVWLEKLASPTPYGEHPPGAGAPEKAKLLKVMNEIRNGAAVTISNNMAIKLLEQIRSSGGDYDQFAQNWRSLIYRLVVGQDFTIQAKGGQNKGDNLMDVFGAILKADSDLLSYSFTLQAATWLRDWNYPGAAVPKVWRKFDDASDLQALSETQKNVFAVGFRPTLKQVIDTYGGDWEVVPSAAPTPPTKPDTNAAPAADTPSFAEPAPAQSTVDQFIDRLGTEAEPLIIALLKPIKTMLDECTDLAEAEARILTLYPDLDARDLGKLLGDAFTATELAGRWELQTKTP